MRLIDADALMPNAELKGANCIVTAYDIVKAPTIDAVLVQDGILKARKGDYVTYRIDYLLDHLAMEIYLLERYMIERKES